MVMALLTNQSGKKQSQSKSSQKGKSSKTSTSPRTSSPEQCSHCQRQGHGESKCWVKHPELRPAKKGGKKEPVSIMAVIKGSSAKSSPTHWYVDSGSSDHFSPYRHLFDNIQPLSEAVTIETAQGTAYGVAKGQIQLTVKTGEQYQDIILKNVLYAPDMHANLLSTNVLYDLGYEVSMKPGIGM